MIETHQTLTIAAPIDAVWRYVRDMARWAALMPGYREFAPIDDDNSRWLLKVGVGGLVRTVKVLVHVDRWAGPEHVEFSFALEGDPVSGSGSYVAEPVAGGATRIGLHVRVDGGGPLAAMWEAMGKPLLPQLAAGFAAQLKAKIEAENAPEIETDGAAVPWTADAAAVVGAPVRSARRRPVLARLGPVLRRIMDSLARIGRQRRPARSDGANQKNMGENRKCG